MILTFDVVGSEDSMVVLLLEPEVAELVLVSELESLPVDVRPDDKSDIDELGPADELEEPADVEKSVSELIEVEIPLLEVDETSIETEVGTELALESDVVDWVGVDVVESCEVPELSVETDAVESLELADGELVLIVLVPVKPESVEDCNEFVLSSLVDDKVLRVAASEVKRNDEVVNELLELGS